MWRAHNSFKRPILTSRQELIKVKGNQVAPAELEALLLDHPAVNDAAVIGLTKSDFLLSSEQYSIAANRTTGTETSTLGHILCQKRVKRFRKKTL